MIRALSQTALQSCLLLLCGFLFSASPLRAQTVVQVIFVDEQEAFETLLTCAASGTCSVSDVVTPEDLRQAVETGIAALSAESSSSPTKDATANATPTTPATTIHGLPGNNPANGGSSASPGGEGVNGGNGIHNIAGGAPGWDGTPTSQTDDGRQPACDMHGGMGDEYGNANCAATD